MNMSRNKGGKGFKSAKEVGIWLQFEIERIRGPQ